jgi:predicted ribosomally synthesized peptide with SipW-like signal peptide
MAYSRKVLTVGALGVAALALIGTGAGATFHDSAKAQQTITAGNLSVLITSPSGSTSPDGKTVTLNTLTNEPSHFSGPQETITVKNNGAVPATVTGFTAADTTNNAYLQGALNIQIVDSNRGEICNDLISTLEKGTGFIPIPWGGTTIATNGTMTVYVTFSSTGNTDVNNGGLPQAAQGGWVTPTLTANVTG